VSVITVERGDKVAHLLDVTKKAEGTVLATFPNLDNHPCAAVQWNNGFTSVTRLKNLEHR
jgi:hypothetical protein